MPLHSIAIEIGVFNSTPKPPMSRKVLIDLHCHYSESAEGIWGLRNSSLSRFHDSDQRSHWHFCLHRFTFICRELWICVAPSPYLNKYYQSHRASQTQPPNSSSCMRGIGQYVSTLAERARPIVNDTTLVTPRRVGILSRHDLSPSL